MRLPPAKSRLITTAEIAALRRVIAVPLSCREAEHGYYRAALRLPAEHAVVRDVAQRCGARAIDDLFTLLSLRTYGPGGLAACRPLNWRVSRRSNRLFASPATTPPRGLMVASNSSSGTRARSA